MFPVGAVSGAAKHAGETTLLAGVVTIIHPFWRRCAEPRRGARANEVVQLERAAGFRREDTPEQRLAKLEAVLAQGANDLSQSVPLLADLLSIPTGDRVIRRSI